jgi:hypothetical protein
MPYGLPTALISEIELPAYLHQILSMTTVQSSHLDCCLYSILRCWAVRRRPQVRTLLTTDPMRASIPIRLMHSTAHRQPYTISSSGYEHHHTSSQLGRHDVRWQLCCSGYCDSVKSTAKSAPWYICPLSTLAGRHLVTKVAMTGGQAPISVKTLHGWPGLVRQVWLGTILTGVLYFTYKAAVGIKLLLYFHTSFIFLQRETKEKARQPEKKPSAIARTRHTARPRNAKRSRTRNPKSTHKARDRPKQPQPRAGRDRASEPGRRHASRRTRPTDTGARCPGKGQR